MRDFVDYIAASIDGFIDGPNEEVDTFTCEGDHMKPHLQPPVQAHDAAMPGRSLAISDIRSHVHRAQPRAFRRWLRLFQ